MEKETIELVKKMIEDGNLTQEVAEKYCPELKESEDVDEKVRKALIKLVTNTASMDLFIEYDIHLDEALAWLEKQGDINPTEDELEALRIAAYEPTKNWSEKLQSLYEKLAHCNRGEQKSIDPDTLIQQRVDALADIAAEQIPVDKVEPKFKNGQWIIFNGLTLYVNKVVQDYYRTTSIDGIPNSYDWSIDNAARLWIIQDAKDGDVLATSAGAFIYNGNNGGGSCPGSYCGINTLGRFQTGIEHHWTGKVVYPATKEQRDTMLKAMTDAGYTFDFEKKELKKIVDKEQIKKNLQDNSFRRIFEQNSAIWSEEDEINLNYITRVIERLYDKQEKNYLKESLERKINWLRTLKDRVQPQQKQEWSEEEQQTIKDAACFILACVNTAETKKEEERLERLADKLQDLRPH